MPIKAIGLLSGGLDSTLAAKLMIDQSIAVHAINFTSPFCTCTPKSAGCSSVATAIKQLGDIPLKKVFMGDEYLTVIKNPKYGYGKRINPCLDCRIMKIKIAVQYMREIKASFLFTGEVLGQRPMSQHRRALTTIDKGADVEGIIVRPLSASHFEPSVPEQKGWIERNKLLSIKGRSRKEQIQLASDKNIIDYPCPAGGCLLTDKNFAERLKDYFDHTSTISIKDMPLLKIGRHFRMENGDKVIIARNELECKALESLCNEEDWLLIPKKFCGPTAILQGKDRPSAIAKLVEFTRADISDEALLTCKNRGKSIDLSRDMWTK